MYSLVIKKAILVISAVQLEIKIPALKFITAIVLELNVEAGPFEYSVIIKNTFF